MADDFKFFLDTGKSGGTPNLSHRVFYVHTLRGDDANNGSNTAPVKTVQKAVDLMTGAAAGGADIVVCGPLLGLDAGSWIGIKASGSLIADGLVFADGSLVSSGLAHSNQSLNIDTYAGGVKRNYGKFLFANYSNQINGMLKTTTGGAYNCNFDNVLNVGVTSGGIGNFSSNVLVNSRLGYNGSNYVHFNPSDVVEKNTFINSQLNCRFGTGVFRSNYFSTTSIFDSTHINPGTPAVWDFNFFQGTLASKIKTSLGTYSNIEAFKSANPLYAVNDLPSATVPLLNSLNGRDFTLQETSPLVKAGHDKKHIGALSVAAVLAANDVSWVATGVDNTTTPGEAILTAQPTGTLEVSGWQISPSKRVLLELGMPDLEQNYSLGEAISVLISALNKPYAIDYEMQYSDDNVTYNGTWLKVPVGVQPLHDIANDVGNSDINFVSGTPIACKYVHVKITFRNNEVIL